MPTGYTDAIKDGITFQQFAMNCARAFGACVTMRDDPSDKPIPERFEPSAWHKERLGDAYAALSELDKMGISEAGRRLFWNLKENVKINGTPLLKTAN